MCMETAGRLTVELIVSSVYPSVKLCFGGSIVSSVGFRRCLKVVLLSIGEKGNRMPFDWPFDRPFGAAITLFDW